MAVRASSLLSRPGLLGLLLRRIRLAVRLAREPRVPVAIKALLALPVLYLVSPIDLLPDLVPLLGQIDDLGVLMLALEGFLKLCPPHLVSFHRDALDAMRPYSPVPDRDVVIDVPFKRG